MERAANVPQNGEKLRELRDSVHKTQVEMARELEVLLKPHMRIGYAIQQADISRLELELTAIDIAKLLAYAHYFRMDIINLLKPCFQLFCKSDIHLQSFETYGESSNYLLELERGGRTLVYARFPSDFFCQPLSGERLRQLSAPTYSSTEIYALDAFLSFMFSPVSAHSLDDKVLILQRYMDYFRNSLHHHLRFFSRAYMENLRHMPNMEVLFANNVLLIPSPILKYQQGDAFFEIRNGDIFEKASHFYQRLPMIDGQLVFLRIGLDTLERMRDGSPARDAIRYFYQQVKVKTFESATAVLDNFSPEIKSMLDVS